MIFVTRSILAIALGFSAFTSSAHAAPLQEPRAFASRDGVLDLLMIARPTLLDGLAFGNFQPQGWAYQVCYRPARGDVCPPQTPTPYGGVRLALQPGDLLKIRLVNALPPVDPATLDHAADDPLLALNPTNLHTHGLIVDATANTAIPPATPVYGDFIFTSVFNPANGDPAQVDYSAYSTLHAHGDIVAGGVVDYRIQLPFNHPRGMFFFHPHMHGIALPQISAGLSGVISVGRVGDYACGDEKCAAPVPDAQVRHLTLKEIQTLPSPSGLVPHLETDAAFCQPDAAPGEPPREGVCPSDPAAYPAGGYWFYTINGQRFPTIPVSAADGEVWRIQNAAGSVTYDLALTDDRTQRKLPLQIVSMDGVSIAVPEGTSPGDMVKLGGGRFRYAVCPNGAIDARAEPRIWPAAAHGPSRSAPVCASEIIMMPSSRVEVWATYTDAANRLAAPPPGASATLQTLHFNTGPQGDDWPAVRLAKVQFKPGSLREFAASRLFVRGEAMPSVAPDGVFRQARAELNPAAATPKSCAPLAPGHRRRVFFANMGENTADVPIFGLGYEEIDEKGRTVPGSYQSIEAFDPGHEICLPLGPHNSPVNETWELINLSAELHNFHIHQTKFKVLSAAAPDGSVLSATSADGAGILADNIPLPFARPADGYQIPDSGACTVDDYRSGKCLVSPALVQIPFSRVGRFVYHCHILEHEDGGMMHAIRVVTSK